MVDEAETQDHPDSDSSSENFFIGTVDTKAPPNVKLTLELSAMSFLYLHIKN